MCRQREVSASACRVVKWRQLHVESVGGVEAINVERYDDTRRTRRSIVKAQYNLTTDVVAMRDHPRQYNSKYNIVDRFYLYMKQKKKNELNQ